MMIKFTHLGVEYEMTEQQIEAAFRYQTEQYRRADARYQLDQFIYGDDPGCLNSMDRQIQEDEFKERYGIDAAEAYELIDKIVDRFYKNESCDKEENTVWQDSIREVLTGQ